MKIAGGNTCAALSSTREKSKTRERTQNPFAGYGERMALSEGRIVRKDEKLCRSVGIDLAEVTGARVPARGGDSTYRGVVLPSFGRVTARNTTCSSLLSARNVTRGGA